MPNIKQQIKRVGTNEKAREINAAKKSRVRNAVKAFRVAVQENDIKLAEEKLNNCISIINRAKSDGIYHANTAARKISTLTREFNQMKTK